MLFITDPKFWKSFFLAFHRLIYLLLLKFSQEFALTFRLFFHLTACFIQGFLFVWILFVFKSPFLFLGLTFLKLIIYPLFRFFKFLLFTFLFSPPDPIVPYFFPSIIVNKFLQLIIFFLILLHSFFLTTLILFIVS